MLATTITSGKRTSRRPRCQLRRGRGRGTAESVMAGESVFLEVSADRFHNGCQRWTRYARTSPRSTAGSPADRLLGCPRWQHASTIRRQWSRSAATTVVQPSCLRCRCLPGSKWWRSIPTPATIAARASGRAPPSWAKPITASSSPIWKGTAWLQRCGTCAILRCRTWCGQRRHRVVVHRRRAPRRTGAARHLEMG